LSSVIFSYYSTSICVFNFASLRRVGHVCDNKDVGCFRRYRERSRRIQ